LNHPRNTRAKASGFHGVRPSLGTAKLKGQDMDFQGRQNVTVAAGEDARAPVKTSTLTHKNIPYAELGIRVFSFSSE
jgi:hypothetical protein